MRRDVFGAGAALLLLALPSLARATGSDPLSGLTLPAQEARDRTAAELRAHYAPPSPARAQALLAAIRPGMPEEEMRRLDACFATPPLGASGGGGTASTYRVDALYVLIVWTDDRRHTVMGAQLGTATEEFWVAPPKDFTGLWVVYHANGQKSHAISYRDGNYDGTFTSFDDQGRPQVIQHYERGVAVGDETDLYPSGAVRVKGSFQGGRPAGRWTFFREDGTVESVQDHPAP